MNIIDPRPLDGAARSEIAAEFAAGWPVVLGANLGLAVGVATVPVISISIFMRAMQADFGWTRAQISLGPAIIIAMLALSAPILGWIADRIRTSWLCASGLAVLAVSLLLFSRLGPDTHLYYVACAAMTLAAAGAGSVPYARAVSAAFVRGRGLALGTAMVGNGISFIVGPLLLAPYAARLGWRQGYVTLAVIVALSAPVVGFLIARAPSRGRTNRSLEPGEVTFGVALRSRTFWALTVCFALIPLSLGGMQMHLLSFLADAGVTPAKAGMIAGSAGIAQIVSRVLSGWLIDRIFAPRVAAAAMTIAAVCIAGLAYFGAPAALLAPVAFGLGMGAEMDLVSYMTVRYFGMRAYGRIYGLLYAACLVGAASSPVFYGSVYDATKSYGPALYTSVGMLLASAMLFLTLRRFDSAPAASATQAKFAVDTAH